MFGSILGGAVHDFLSGAISCRNGGVSITELSRDYLGNVLYQIMRIFIMLLLILVVAVFASSPAALLAKISPGALNTTFWMIVILIYYTIATILPVDKLIAKIYPFFGILLAIMAVGILGGLLVGGYRLPELTTLQSLHPKGLPAWPFMFITVACGAISGFHATQSPIVAKCITSERLARPIFYGAMLTESVIALIWAAAGVAFYGATNALNDALTASGQAGVVYDISRSLLGSIGSVLAIIGIVVCPISSGDTALRALRLMLSERFHISQKNLKNRLLITAPLLAIVVILSTLDFSVIWRYFGWANQTLAVFVLWISTAYLLKNCKYRLGSLIAAIPAAFMTAVCVTYILVAPEGFQIATEIAYPIGLVTALALFVFYLVKLNQNLAKSKL